MDILDEYQKMIKETRSELTTNIKIAKIDGQDPVIQSSSAEFQNSILTFKYNMNDGGKVHIAYVSRLGISYYEVDALFPMNDEWHHYMLLDSDIRKYVGATQTPEQYMDLIARCVYGDKKRKEWAILAYLDHNKVTRKPQPPDPTRNENEYIGGNHNMSTPPAHRRGECECTIQGKRYVRTVSPLTGLPDWTVKEESFLDKMKARFRRQNGRK